MTTHKESKASRSRSESERGPVRRGRKRGRLEEHRKIKHLVWNVKNQLKQEKVELALLGFMGSVAVSVYDKMMERKSKGEKLAGYEKRKVIEDALVKEIPLKMASERIWAAVR